MGFTDKLAGSITVSIDELRNDIRSDLENISKEITALAGLGMIAFALISIVAVTALVKASK
jgi:predicted transcriptional regulator